MHDFYKYHGLGNDYLVLNPTRFPKRPSERAIRLLCDRNQGVGADGVLWGPLPREPPDPPNQRDYPLLIFNPDGSEAEKSGNGLRIFARYLWEHHHLPEFQNGGEGEIVLLPPGGPVRARVLDPQGSRFGLAMGPVSFDGAVIPVTGMSGEVLRKEVDLAGRKWTFSCATLGNPHCVVESGEPSAELARSIGPLLETHAMFPRRSNVQFMKVLDPHAIQIEIWERGAGYTLASGTSSCAAAAVACRLGLCASPVTVHMPGGTLVIRLDANFNAELAGAVRGVCQGRLSQDFLVDSSLERREN